jgi:hypothetical protein
MSARSATTPKRQCVFAATIFGREDGPAVLGLSCSSFLVFLVSSSAEKVQRQSKKVYTL